MAIHGIKDNKSFVETMDKTALEARFSEIEGKEQTDYNELDGRLDGLETDVGDSTDTASTTGSIWARVKNLLTRMTAVESGKQNKLTAGTNITITSANVISAKGATIFTNQPASAWIADATYSDYAYRCAIALSGVTASDVAEVVFSQADASSGNYASVCETYAGGVYVYGSVNTSITIPTILIHKG